jgi:hypothetical protein
MALINCPECGKEVSTSAVACPNCGHPLAPPTLEERTVVREVPAPVVERDSFPKWIFVPLALLGAILIFLLFALFRQGNNQSNINVNVTAKRPGSVNSDSTTRSEPNQIDVPPTSSDTNISTVPQTIPQTSDTTVTQIPADVENATQGTLSLEAKVSDRTGNTKPVKAEKFYLLDEDLETILNDADIKPVNGQTLKNSFGLSVLYPDRYREINKQALDEIKKHIKYDVTTDGGGKAQMKGIKPDSYYLFAVTKTGNGFAIWSSPIVINPGQNILNLSPQPMTEVQEEE